MTTSVPPAASPKSGALIVVATPIGNLDDLSPRAQQTLANADLIACEDTRRTAGLMRHIDSHVPLVAVHDHNEAQSASKIVAKIAEGKTVVLVSDAGTPTISDPGYKLVRAVRQAGHQVLAIPGPSAVLHALAVAGLPTDRWAFEGFLPRKETTRRQRLGAVSRDDRTLVYYLSPHRVADDLNAMADVFGSDRPAVLCRELTKVYEESIDGTLGTLHQWATDTPPRGEVTLVVAGAQADNAGAPSEAELVQRVTELVAEGLSKRDAIRRVADETGVSKRVVYAAANG